MSREQLLNNLNLVINQENQLSTVLYAVMRDNHEIKKLDIANDEIGVIQAMFIQSIKDKIVNVEGQTIIKVSEADNRANTVFEYDLDLPQGLAFYSFNLTDQITFFSFQDDDLSSIESLIIKIGNEQHQIRIFKKISNVEIFGRGGFLLWKSGNRLKRFEDKVLRLTSNFDALSIGDNYVFLSLRLLEASHGFHEVIVREATNSLQLLNNIGVLESTQGIQDLLGKTSFAKKVVKIRNSPVFTKNIPNQQIIAFTKSHPSLANKMRYSDDGNQIILHSILSRELFIKMLDDTYLTSELTSEYYESIAKDLIQLDEVVEQAN